MERRRSKDTAHKDHAKQVLVWLFAGMIVLVGALGAGVWKGDAQWTPRLGLDLAGGTQIVLEPRVEGGGTVSEQQLAEARDIIVQRIDSQGTTGAEVTTQGGSNIVVALPGTPTQEQEDAISASSQMQFRPVLATDIGSDELQQPGPSGTQPPAPDSGVSEPSEDSSSSPSSAKSDESVNRSETSGSRDQARAAEPKSSSTSASTSPSKKSGQSAKSKAPKPTPSAPAWTPSGKPTSAMDPNNISTKLWKEFQALDCADPPKDSPITTDKPIVACGDDGTMKYVLGPVVVSGTEIADAEAGYRVGNQGQQTNEPEISLSLTSTGREQYGDISKQMVTMPGLQPPINPPGEYNALAAVLDSKVLIAPGFNEAIPNGQASISGFEIEEARSLAKSLKFGALPLSFDLQTRQEISPTLGSEQLRYGILAGIIGLFVVLLYSVVQYRALAIVTIGSMAIAFSITYLAIALLAWQYNYRLDMAGVTGLIIAIGVTADSFIVYFERVRDELREGRNLRAAVEAGWGRAKGTILVADGVNLIAAIVLYVLASSGVRGFAFTLGLTTLIDLAIFWLFTHPMLTILARNTFFASGHPWSGFDVNRLREAKMRYRGRGQVDVSPALTTAEGSIR